MQRASLNKSAAAQGSRPGVSQPQTSSQPPPTIYFCLSAPECCKEGRHACAWKSTLPLINGMQLNFNVLRCKPLPQIAWGCATN